jgi:hypothetical protein
LSPTGLYRPTVATIRINPKLDIVDGGNTFRALYHCLVTLDLVDSIEALVLYNEDFSFQGYNQLDADRSPQQVLDLMFGDGWGKFRQQLFGLSCLRSKGNEVGGGGDTARTWLGKAYLSTDDIGILFANFEPWFSPVFNGYAFVKSTKGKQSFSQLVETISTTFKYFNADNDGSLLFIAVLDRLLDNPKYSLDTLEDTLDEILPKAIDDLATVVSNPKFISKLGTIWKPAKGLPTYNRHARYCWLCSLVYVAFEGLDIDKITPKFVPPQGIQKIITKGSDIQ